MAQSQSQPQRVAQQPAEAPPRSEQRADDQVPERPKRAPNIELRGEMQESGFEAKQWLVQRDGRYIQLTELLYHVTDQADGERTLAEIAEGVSRVIDRRVSADNVKQLLQKKLIPMGLVAKADGSVAVPGGDTGDTAARSPLAVNMRMKMLSPRFIEPVTAVLQVLWKPPILIPMLVAAGAAHIWLYFIKGVGRGFHEALYAPGLLLVLLGIIVLSAAFHEFGHASALRYGGGKVGGMGAGMYLIYPAFYTDVTDNYRLSRWSRIRTDLGGFYFNLIFELGLLALYFLTGLEFLLVAIVLLDLEIVHQSLPFVRLDGYWALADLTGIPDFFSHIGPYLRTILPLPWWKGRKLPQLKPWVKAVFGLYILVTVPLLLLLLFMMIRGVPRVLATAWDSLGQQVAAFSEAQNGTDLLGMAAAAVQIVTLAIPTLGMVYVLFKLGRRLVTAVWNWSKPTPTRRVVGALGSAAAVAGLVFLWAPQLPFRPNTPGPLYAAARSRFVPIRANERGTIGDIVNVSGGGGGRNQLGSEQNVPGAGPMLDGAATETAATPPATNAPAAPTAGTPSDGSATSTPVRDTQTTPTAEATASVSPAQSSVATAGATGARRTPTAAPSQAATTAATTRPPAATRAPTSAAVPRAPAATPTTATTAGTAQPPTATRAPTSAPAATPTTAATAQPPAATSAPTSTPTDHAAPTATPVANSGATPMPTAGQASETTTPTATH